MEVSLDIGRKMVMMQKGEGEYFIMVTQDFFNTREELQASSQRQTDFWQPNDQIMF